MVLLYLARYPTVYEHLCSASPLVTLINTMASILNQVSFRDLAAVSLASRKLHDFATPHLYSQIEFDIDRNDPRPLIHLARSIFNNPALAAHVKSVHLRDGEPEIQTLHSTPLKHHDTPKASPPRLADGDGMPDFVSFIGSSGLSYADLWTDKLRAGDLNATVALLLSKLPNLASFRVGYAVVLPYLETGEHGQPKTKGENQFLGKLFQSAVFNRSDHGLPRFKHLKEISYPGPLETDPGQNPDFANPQDLMALLGLPSIRSISGWSLNPSALPFTWPSSPPDPVYLTTLSLKYVHVNFLAQILERTRALKFLSWEWMHIPDIELGLENTTTVELDKFVEALRPVQGTLEDLTISYTNCRPWNNYEERRLRVQGSLNGLEKFASIKRFKSPLSLLLPDWEFYENPKRRLEDSLPRRVEVVAVTDAQTTDAYAYDEDSEMEMLLAWLWQTASTRTPHLKEVCVYLELGKPAWYYEKFHVFRQEFEGTSVKCRIIREKDEKKP
jgi:hypothetical protein